MKVQDIINKLSLISDDNIESITICDGDKIITITEVNQPKEEDEVISPKDMSVIDEFYNIANKREQEKKDMSNNYKKENNEINKRKELIKAVGILNNIVCPEELIDYNMY